MGFTLDAQVTASVVVHLLAGTFVRIGVDQNAAVGVLHEAGGKVHLVAHDGVLLTHLAADGAAVHATRGDADAAAQLQLVQHAMHGERGKGTARRVVFMGKRWQAQRGNQGHAFVVHRQLVDAAFKGKIQRLLQAAHGGLSDFQRRVVANVGQIDKQNR